VRQGDVISPIIFNIVVDCVLREWYNQIGSTDLSAVFYADDGRLAGYSVDTVQYGLDLLVSLFGRVGLHPNATKTKAMLSIGMIPSGPMSDIAYKHCLEAQGLSYYQCKRARIICPHCLHSMADQYFPRHLFEFHQIRYPLVATNVSEHAEDACTYVVHHPSSFSPTPCPVPNCPALLRTQYGTHIHFASRHVDATLVIPEAAPSVRCPCCHMFLSTSNSTHLNSITCATFARRFASREARKRQQHLLTEMEFTVEGSLLARVQDFKYLGRWLSQDDSDTLAVQHNLQKARKCWGQLSRLLSRHHARPRTMARFYTAVVQAILLYGCETWVLTHRDLHS
jgi:hypothetical protein